MNQLAFMTTQDLEELIPTTLHLYDMSVVDADGLRACLQIRLYGIDAPEHDQPFFKQACRLLRKLTTFRRMQTTCIFKGVDCYGRILATVKVNGIDLALALCKKGLAWGLCDEYQQAALKAQHQRKGLWINRSPTEPRDAPSRIRRRKVAL